MGTRKLLQVVRLQLGERPPQVGRDYLFALLATHGPLVRRRKRRVLTTPTCLPSFWHPSLIEYLVVQQAKQVWVSNITCAS